MAAGVTQAGKCDIIQFGKDSAEYIRQQIFIQQLKQRICSNMKSNTKNASFSTLTNMCFYGNIPAPMKPRAHHGKAQPSNTP